MKALRDRIAAAAVAADRDPAEIDLLAVSKGHPAGAVRTALDLGLRRFGESYVSEVLPKMAELADSPAEWVYLGPIQSNKTRQLAENFAWVLGLSSEKAARRLAAQRSGHLPPLQVCVQVNVDGDPAKSGIAPEQLDAFLEVLDALPRLRVRGLMTIPRHEPGGVPPGFAVLADLYAKHRAGGRDWDTLSMGMSGDFEAAIAAGSTQVRLGTSLFGPRPATWTAPGCTQGSGNG
jgi:hypothetical protein